MPGHGLEPGKHDISRARWQWDSPFAWAQPPPRPRRRRGDKKGRGIPGFVASLLARIRPPSGAHHADPGTPPPPPPPPADDGCSPGAPTLLDFLPGLRVPGYMPDIPEQQPQGRHHG